jgi:hypothetical protein
MGQSFRRRRFQVPEDARIVGSQPPFNAFFIEAFQQVVGDLA